MNPVDKWIFSEDGEAFYTELMYDTREQAAEAFFSADEIDLDVGYVARIVETGSIKEIINDWCIDGILQHLEEQTEVNSVVPIEDSEMSSNKFSDSLIDEVRQAFIKYLVSNSKPIRTYDVEDLTTIERVKEDGKSRIIFNPSEPVSETYTFKKVVENEPSEKHSIFMPEDFQIKGPARSMVWG